MSERVSRRSRPLEFGAELRCCDDSADVSGGESPVQLGEYRLELLGDLGDHRVRDGDTEFT